MLGKECRLSNFVGKAGIIWRKVKGSILLGISLYICLMLLLSTYYQYNFYSYRSSHHSLNTPIYKEYKPDSNFDTRTQQHSFYSHKHQKQN